MGGICVVRPREGRPSFPVNGAAVPPINSRATFSRAPDSRDPTKFTQKGGCNAPIQNRATGKLRFGTTVTFAENEAASLSASIPQPGPTGGNPATWRGSVSRMKGRGRTEVLVGRSSTVDSSTWQRGIAPAKFAAELPNDHEISRRYVPKQTKTQTSSIDCPGQWLVAEGVRVEYAEEVYRITPTASSKGISLLCPTRKVMSRGDTLNLGTVSLVCGIDATWPPR